MDKMEHDLTKIALNVSKQANEHPRLFASDIKLDNKINKYSYDAKYQLSKLEYTWQLDDKVADLFHKISQQFSNLVYDKFLSDNLKNINKNLSLLEALDDDLTNRDTKLFDKISDDTFGIRKLN